MILDRGEHGSHDVRAQRVVFTVILGDHQNVDCICVSQKQHLSIFVHRDAGGVVHPWVGQILLKCNDFKR